MLFTLYKLRQQRHISKQRAQRHMTSSRPMGASIAQRVARAAYLGLDVGIVVVLEKQRRWLCVVLAGGDVQGGQADLAFGVILQEDGDDLVVALLKGNGQRSEAILKEDRHFYIHSVAQQQTGSDYRGPSSHYSHYFMFDDKYWQDHYKSCIPTLWFPGDGT